jgi:Predicted Fe-S protein
MPPVRFESQPVVSVESPCIDECALAEGVCIGCGRTKKEVTSWATMTEEQQQRVLERLSG